MLENKNTRVAHWNHLCNNNPLPVGTPEYWQSLKNQAERILEEVKETLEAIGLKKPIDLLDGIVDVRVTLEGLEYLAQMRHEEAYIEVMDNNDLKYTEDYEEAYEALEHHSLEHFNIQEVTFEGRKYFSVHRNIDNKINKLLDHPQVELAHLVGDSNV